MGARRYRWKSETCRPLQWFRQAKRVSRGRHRAAQARRRFGKRKKDDEPTLSIDGIDAKGACSYAIQHVNAFATA